jgi:hypothetical protein
MTSEILCFIDILKKVLHWTINKISLRCHLED